MQTIEISKSKLTEDEFSNSKIENVNDYVEKLTSKEGLEQLKESVTVESRIGDSHFIDTNDFDTIKRKEVVNDRKVDIMRLQIDELMKSNQEVKRDYITEIGHQMSVVERKEVAKLTGEMTQSLKNNQKENELRIMFLKRNLNSGLAGHLNNSQNKWAKRGALLIAGVSTKISQLSFNISDFLGINKDWYLTPEEKTIDNKIQSEKIDEKELKVIRAEAMKTVVDKSKNLTQEQKDNFNKVYQALRLETEAQVEQVAVMNQKKSMIDKIKSPIEDVISSTSLKKLARGAKNAAKYAVISIGVISTKLALNTVVPFVGWVAGGAVGGSVREMIYRSNYSYDAWKKEIDSLVEQGKVGQARALANTIVEKNWLVGERVEYQKMSRVVREFSEGNDVDDKNYDVENKEAKKNQDKKHDRSIGKSAAIGAAFGGVAGFVHALGGVLFGTPVHAEENLITAPKFDYHNNVSDIDKVYQQDGSIDFDSLKQYCSHDQKGILYNQDVKQVIADNSEYFANKENLYNFLNETGVGEVGFSKEQLIRGIDAGESVVHNQVPEGQGFYVSYLNSERGMGVPQNGGHVDPADLEQKFESYVETIPGDKGYAIIVDKNGVEHMATDVDDLGDIVDNKGNILSQYPGETADLYNNSNSCDNLYVALKYYADYESAGKFMHNLGVDPDMVVRGTDGQTISQWMIQNSSRFNETNYDLMKWIVYRDPAGAKEVMDVICDDTKDYVWKKELYQYYLDIPTDSPRWEEVVDVNGAVQHNHVSETGHAAVEEEKVLNPIVNNSGNDVVNGQNHEPSYINENLKKYLGENKTVEVTGEPNDHDDAMILEVNRREEILKSENLVDRNIVHELPGDKTTVIIYAKYENNSTPEDYYKYNPESDEQKIYNSEYYKYSGSNESNKVYNPDF